MRGNTKPFGKWLSPCAETPNHLGNDFRHARKCQTLREMTFGMRGNAKPFGKRLSPCAETPNLSGNDFRHVRKLQTFREVICGRPASAKSFKKWFAGGPQALNPLKTICGRPYRRARFIKNTKILPDGYTGNTKCNRYGTWAISRAVKAKYLTKFNHLNGMVRYSYLRIV